MPDENPSASNTLYEAARRIRATLCYGGSGHPFYAAVADLLEHDAHAAPCKFCEYPRLACEDDGGCCSSCDHGDHALTVARAFLGGGTK